MACHVQYYRTHITYLAKVARLDRGRASIVGLSFTEVLPVILPPSTLVGPLPAR